MYERKEKPEPCEIGSSGPDLQFKFNLLVRVLNTCIGNFSITRLLVPIFNSETLICFIKSVVFANVYHLMNVQTDS